MSIVTSASFTKALWPGVNAWYGKAYNDYPVEFLHLFDKNTSRKAFEEDVGITSFGLAQVKPEGGSIAYDSENSAGSPCTSSAAGAVASANSTQLRRLDS